MNVLTSTIITEATPPDLIDETAGGDIYLGWLNLGEDETSTAVRIIKIEVSGTQLFRKYPNGSKEFAYSWANRASLTYNFAK